MKFTKKYDIDEYIENNELNSRIYKVLLSLQNNDIDIIPLRRNPIEIFNQAYYLCESFEKEKHPETKVQSLISKTQELFLDYETAIVFACVYVILYFSDSPNSHIDFCLHKIKSVVDPLYFQYFEPLLKEELSIQSLPKSFNQIKKQADEISDLNTREMFYADILTRFKQAKAKGNIMQQIEDELALIQREKNLSVNNVVEIDGDKNTSTTKVRSVVIMEMLRKMQSGKAYNDLTKICKLIAFLTGRNYDKIYNEAQKGITLTNYHSKEISEINKIFSDLNISISIDKDKQY
ncbi:MAG: hypothetical protein IKS65_01460 [Bacteroidales bacterium]|nr:hypothetical protein [Bacteroidales bacterium]